MDYFVIMPDGSRYGPTDLGGLNAWAKEGRILPETRIEEKDSGKACSARELAGLELSPSATWIQPTQGYYRTPSTGSVTPGNSEFIAALVLALVTLPTCCPVLPGFGLWMANKAVAAGHPNGNVVKILNIVILSLTLLFYVVYIGFIVVVGIMSASQH